MTRVVKLSMAVALADDSPFKVVRSDLSSVMSVDCVVIVSSADVIRESSVFVAALVALATSVGKLSRRSLPASVVMTSSVSP